MVEPTGEAGVIVPNDGYLKCYKVMQKIQCFIYADKVKQDRTNW